MLVFTLLPWNLAWRFIWEPIEDDTALIALEIEVQSIVGKKIFSETAIDELAQKIKSFEEKLTDVKIVDFQKLFSESRYTLPIQSFTQNSVNVFKDYRNFVINKSEYATGGSLIHDQSFSNLCHSFVVMTAFRKEIQNQFIGEKSKRSFKLENDQNVEQRSMTDLLENKYGFDKPNRNCTFEAFIAEFTGSMNPRSVFGLHGNNYNQREISSQFAELEIVIKRLVKRTKFFKKEGWRRMYVLRKLFYEFNRKKDDFQLDYQVVCHPLAIKNKLVKLFETHKSSTTSFDEALADGHYVMTCLVDITNDGLMHAVIIYGFDENSYKIKDSQGSKYVISKNRSTYFQVSFVKCMIIFNPKIFETIFPKNKLKKSLG